MHKLPNILTIFRIFIIPVMILSFYVPSPFANVLSALLFAIASITDYFDGYFARSLNAETNFGRCLDPIADKLVVVVAIVLVISFSNHHPLVMIPGLVIVCRELLVSGLREFLAGFKISVPVSKLAKYKTGIQMTSITIMLLGEKGTSYVIDGLFGSMLNYELRTDIVLLVIHGGVLLFVIASILTVLTGYKYFRAGMKKM